MKSLKRFILLAAVIAAVALTLPRHYFAKKPDCVQSEQIFTEYESTNAEYQSHVRDILEKHIPRDFRYFFVTFTGESDELVIINMRNDNYCFDVLMIVRDWQHLQLMLETNGQSFPEELYNVKWSLSSEQVVFEGMRRIMD